MCGQPARQRHPDMKHGVTDRLYFIAIIYNYYYIYIYMHEIVLVKSKPEYRH